MNMKIEVVEKSNYGAVVMYVVSEHKEAIQRLTGHKSITWNDVNNLKLLGFTVELKQQEAKAL